MQSRRDQVQAQTYVIGRLTSALVMAEPEAAENPHRRIVVGTFVSVLIAALVVGGFVGYGYLRPGGANSWRQPGVLILEKETGGSFVLVDGVLRPVLNYTSAVLLFGGRPTVTAVSSKSLRSVTRGTPVGIVGAPETLPDANALHGAAWTVCAVSRTDQAGTRFTGTTLAVGTVTPDRTLDPAHGLAAQATTGETFLVWHGKRFALTRDWMSRAFGYDGPPVLVEPGWLDQLPVGPDVAPVSVPGRGEPGPVVDGVPTRIGQIFVSRVVAGTSERFYLLHRDGLRQISGTAAAVMLSDPDTAVSYGSRPVEPVELTAASLAALPVSQQPALSDDLPPSPPVKAEAAGPDHSWCVRRSGPEGTVDVTAEPTPALLRAADGVGVSRTEQTASVVTMAPGVGGVARLGYPDQANGSSLFLITDAGVKFPLAGPAVAEALGYPPATAAIVPPALLALLPTGPVLDPQQARR